MNYHDSLEVLRQIVMLSMGVDTCGPSTGDRSRETCLWVWGKLYLQNELQDIQSCIIKRHSLKRQKEKRKKDSYNTRMIDQHKEEKDKVKQWKRKWQSHIVDNHKESNHGWEYNLILLRKSGRKRFNKVTGTKFLFSLLKE